MFEPYMEEKVWGQVQHIFGSPQAGVSCLTVKAGYRCSLHYHRYRGNLFNVLEGCIIVETFGKVDGESPPWDSQIQQTRLGPGDTLAVPPLIWHRFRVLVSGRVVEVYWDVLGSVDISDIVRLDVGGEDLDISAYVDYEDE